MIPQCALLLVRCCAHCRNLAGKLARKFREFPRVRDVYSAFKSSPDVRSAFLEARVTFLTNPRECLHRWRASCPSVEPSANVTVSPCWADKDLIPEHMVGGSVPFGNICARLRLVSVRCADGQIINGSSKS